MYPRPPFNENLPKEALDMILYLLPNTPNYRVWTKDADEILCETEQMAEHIADFIDILYGDCVTNTGYYDPEEDERNGETDERTGWYYVSIS